MNYIDSAEEAARRIEALIPTHPEILTMDSPFKLFKIREFISDDLDLTLASASAALARACANYRGK